MNDKRSDGPRLVEGIVDEKTTCSERTKRRRHYCRNGCRNQCRLLHIKHINSSDTDIMAENQLSVTVNKELEQ